jgi:2-dehydropantoate 2-reductase
VSLSYAVLGAGGVGGLVGGALARAGHPVTLVVRPGSARPSSLHVESDVLGTFEAGVGAETELEEPVDVLWVTVKYGQLESALRQVTAGAVRELVIPLLNGVEHVEPLRAHFGAERVAVGTIAVEAEREAPGRIRQRGGFLNVSLGGSRRELLDAVAADLNAAGVSTRVVEDAERALWAKLIMLAPIALTTTASQLAVGPLRDDSEWRSLLLGSMHEIHEVAAAQGIELTEPVAAVDAVPAGMRSSMQKDAAAGRPLELDHIGGAVLRAGRRLGVPTPATERLVELIRARYPSLA